MTRVIEIRELEDCFDGSFMKEVEIDEPLSEKIMHRMAQDANLDYYQNFPRPYFRIEKNGVFVVQGIIGNRIFRATLSRLDTSNAQLALKCLIEEK